MKFFFLSCFMLIAFAACRHDAIESGVIEPKSIIKPWERVDLYKYYSTNIIASYSTDSMLFAAAPSGLSVWDKRQKSDFTSYLLSWANSAFYPRPIFSDRIVATMSDSILSLKSVFFPVTSGGPDLRISSGSIRPNYRFARLGSASAFIGDKVYLLVALGSSGVGNNNAAIALLELEHTGKEDNKIKLLKTTFYSLNTLPSTIVGFMECVNNKFYITADYVYSLDLTGNLKKLDITTTNNQYLLKFFSVGKDSIMGVAERNNVYLSTDNGNNFRFYASITSNASLLQPEYYYFKNRLFFQIVLTYTNGI